MAEQAGLPLLAEPSSNARAGRCAIARYRNLLDTELGARIERVLIFGHPTLSRPVNRLLTSDDIELIVVGRGSALPNPGNHASAFAADVWMEPDRTGWPGEWLRRSRRSRARRIASPRSR